MKKKPKVISERTWNGRQSWEHELIEQVGDVRLRYKVDWDAYEDQSSAKAQVWSENKWSIVHYIPGSELKLPFSYVSRGITAAHFQVPMAELRRVAHAVLGL